MIYSREPNEEENEELRRMIRQETGRISQRARLILLSSQRRTTTELAAIFSSDKVTVRRWIHRFNVSGPTGLYDEPRPGRPRKDGRSKLVDDIENALAPPMPMASIWSPTSGAAVQPSIFASMPVPEDLETNQEDAPSLTVYAVRYKQRPRAGRQGRRRRRVRC
jgi:hypothetical protein